MPIVAAPPPAKTAPRAKPVARTSGDRIKERSEALNGIGQLGQAGLVAIKQFADAGAIGIHGPRIAHEVAELAEDNERVAQILEPLLQAGPYTGLLMAVLPMVMQIGVNHGRLAPGPMGTLPPATLSSRIQAEIARAEVQALQAQKAAEQESRDLQAEIAKARNDGN